LLEFLAFEPVTSDNGLRQADMNWFAIRPSVTEKLWWPSGQVAISHSRQLRQNVQSFQGEID
jgi:hypothetical protein